MRQTIRISLFAFASFFVVSALSSGPTVPAEAEMYAQGFLSTLPLPTTLPSLEQLFRVWLFMLVFPALTLRALSIEEADTALMVNLVCTLAPLALLTWQYRGSSGSGIAAIISIIIAMLLSGMIHLAAITVCSRLGFRRAEQVLRILIAR